MAKYELSLTADFKDFLVYLEDWVINANISASLEDQSDYQNGEFHCAVRVFERYSMIGENRLSLSIVLVGQGDQLFLSGITSGGSKGVLFKINTFGEEAYLEILKKAVKSYQKTQV